MKNTVYTLERPVHFLREQPTGLYEWYCPGVAQLKNGLGVKNGLQGRTWFGLERHGV